MIKRANARQDQRISGSNFCWVVRDDYVSLRPLKPPLQASKVPNTVIDYRNLHEYDLSAVTIFLFSTLIRTGVWLPLRARLLQVCIPPHTNFRAGIPLVCITRRWSPDH